MLRHLRHRSNERVAAIDAAPTLRLAHAKALRTNRSRRLRKASDFDLHAREQKVKRCGSRLLRKPAAPFQRGVSPRRFVVGDQP
jgi:hypothetical protein